MFSYEIFCFGKIDDFQQVTLNAKELRNHNESVLVLTFVPEKGIIH